MAQSRRRVLMRLMVLAAGSLIFGIPSHGDTYSFNTFSNPLNASFFYGIDSVGNFVINLFPPSPCGDVVNSPTCYETHYIRTNQTILSVNPPNLHYDEGSPCSISNSFYGGVGLCNNGHEIFSGIINNEVGLPVLGVWTGPDPIRDALLLTHPTNMVEIFGIDPFGDVIFSDETYWELFFAEDLTSRVSPEPGTLFLVGSGGLMLIVLLIRRKAGKDKQLRRGQCLS